MPFISEAASAIKNRFGFHSHSASLESAQQLPSLSTPNLLKSSSKESSVPATTSSAVRRIGDWEEDNGASASAAAMVVPSQSFELREDPSFWKDHNVQVIIRIRPLSSSEISLQGYGKCVRQESSQTVTWIGHPETRFTFDLVADETVSQEKLFKVAGVPMVENCMGGYNSCMFAYGQTGSGKTHTMLGDIEGGIGRPNVNCGMTPRVFEYLFSRIQKEKDVRKDEKLRFTCKCSFLEIYNEQILDLLDPSSINLQIREDSKKGVYVENLKEIEVTSARDVMQQLIQGAANRKVAATNMNRASSRSHSVFTCVIESKWEAQGIIHHRFSRLNLVDLAGSERQKTSGAEGERLKEATNINKSLSTLGLVIMNLVSISNGKSQHVPYRDSKLTFLLQDSLGGNSKTIIIANVSPSSGNSLETLSTLKFAQRAKYIKNNAIVNEDASGDVIAMRMQIQQLKKEVCRLQGLVHGGSEILENGGSGLSFPGSPGFLKWEGLQGSFSPLTSNKRMSQKKDYEVALVGAFKREKDKDIALQSLAAENQAALQLAKQREDEIKSLRMRLRFREAAIKRLESVASGKISAETHLLKENEEHLQEIEALRTQVNRNQEVTRFAMENLRLKEEIRRLKAFFEDGERDIMKEQISVLQNKLLEALDWKLMHESDPSLGHNPNSAKGDSSGGNLFTCNEELGLPSHSLLTEENEFLRIQAIQNQAEIDTLRKKLDLCLEEREKLERYVNDLVRKLEDVRSSGAQQSQLPSLSVNAPVINSNDQTELKTMVDAIGAASQREVEARELANKLSKENDELRMKIKILIEDNNKLIELYENASAENNRNMNKNEDTLADGSDVHKSVGFADVPAEKEIETREVVEKLEHQLTEMHEENDKLMNLYEQAMQERDEFKRMLCNSEQNEHENKGYEDCPEKLVEVDAGEHSESVEPLLSSKENVPMENTCPDGKEKNSWSQKHHICGESDTGRLVDAGKKLDVVSERLQISSNTIAMFGSLEKDIIEDARLHREIETVQEIIQSKQEELKTNKLIYAQLQERRDVTDKKMSALKYSITSFSSSIGYFELREARAKARLGTSKSHLRKKEEELSHLQAQKEKNEAALVKVQETEIELRHKFTCLKSKLEEENKRMESEKVLFAIDNIEKTDSQKSCLLAGKATDLLRSEEEKPKLQAELKLTQQRLGSILREVEELNRNSVKLENQMQAAQMEIIKSSRTVKEMQTKLQDVIQEMETLLEMTRNGKTEFETLMVDYQQHVFEADMKEAEIEILGKELQVEERRLEDTQRLSSSCSCKITQLLEMESNSNMTQRIGQELQNVQVRILEVQQSLRG